jgi:hypothetical protein
MHAMMRVVCIAGLVAGCARQREPAPDEMKEIASFMIRNWDDDRALEDAMENLAPWLVENTLTDDALDGFELTPLAPASVETLDRPDRSLSGLLGAAVAGVSRFGIEPHVQTILLEDQVFLNPSNYEFYIRTVEGDRERFVSEQNGYVDTINDIETASFGVSIPYTLNKDYKWVYGDDIPPAIIARSWIPERGCSPNGENCLELSFSVDLWWVVDGQPGFEDGTTIRFTSTWSEVTSPIDGLIGDDLQIAALANGMGNVFVATDTFIEEEGLD